MQSRHLPTAPPHNLLSHLCREKVWKAKCVSTWAANDGRQWLISKNAQLVPHWESLGRPTGKVLAKMKRKRMEQKLGEDIGAEVYTEVAALLLERKNQLGNKFNRYAKQRGE